MTGTVGKLEVRDLCHRVSQVVISSVPVFSEFSRGFLSFFFLALDSCSVFWVGQNGGRMNYLSLSYWGKYSETRRGQNLMWTVCGQCAPVESASPCKAFLTLTSAILCIYFSFNHYLVSLFLSAPPPLSFLIRVCTSVSISSRFYSSESSLMICQTWDAHSVPSAGLPCVCLCAPVFTAHPCQRSSLCFLKQQSYCINIGSRWWQDSCGFNLSTFFCNTNLMQM